MRAATSGVRALGGQPLCVLLRRMSGALRPKLHRQLLVQRQLQRSMLKSSVAPWQRPSFCSAPVPPQGAPGSSGWLGAPRGETGPLGA